MKGAVRPLLQDRAYESLKALIQDGAVPPGAFLSERLLSDRLRMSKTPIRAALTRLDVEGLVSVSPQQGVLIREPSLQEIVDLFDIRAALETLVVRRLAGRLTPVQARALRENLEEEAEAAREHDETRLTRLDADFHVKLCEFLGNREIEHTMGRLRDKLHRVILRVLGNARNRLRSTVREHAGIAQAIFRGKPDLAARRMKEHLEFGRKFLIDR